MTLIINVAINEPTTSFTLSLAITVYLVLKFKVRKRKKRNHDKTSQGRKHT